MRFSGLRGWVILNCMSINLQRVVITVFGTRFQDRDYHTTVVYHRFHDCSILNHPSTTREMDGRSGRICHAVIAFTRRMARDESG